MTLAELLPDIRSMVWQKFPYTHGYVSQEDLAQAGVVKILEAGYTEIDKSLAMTIAHRGAVDELRKHRGRNEESSRRRGENTVEIEEHHAVANADEMIFKNLERREQLDIIADCLGKLPPMEHFVLARRFWGELTFREIGEEMDRSEARAHQLHRQGLARLRKILVAKGYS